MATQDKPVKKQETQPSAGPTKQQVESDVLSIRFLESQLNSLRQQVLLLEENGSALSMARISLTDLKKVDKESPALIPMGVGVLAHGSLKKSDRLLVGIGAGVVVEKTLDETLLLIKKREEEVQKQLAESQNAFMAMSSEHQRLADKLDKEIPLLQKQNG